MDLARGLLSPLSKNSGWKQKYGGGVFSFVSCGNGLLRSRLWQQQKTSITFPCVRINVLKKKRRSTRTNRVNNTFFIIKLTIRQCVLSSHQKPFFLYTASKFVFKLLLLPSLRRFFVCRVSGPSSLISACSYTVQFSISISLHLPSDNAKQKLKKRCTEWASNVDRLLRTNVSPVIRKYQRKTEISRTPVHEVLLYLGSLVLSPRNLDRVDMTHFLSFANMWSTPTASINLFLKPSPRLRRYSTWSLYRVMFAVYHIVRGLTFNCDRLNVIDGERSRSGGSHRNENAKGEKSSGGMSTERLPARPQRYT